MLTSSFGTANTRNAKTSVRGVLRTRLTYVAPNARRAGTGDTRIAPSSVPRTRLPTAAIRKSLTVLVNPSTNSCPLSVSTRKNSPMPRSQSSDGRRTGTSPARRRNSCRAGRSVPLDLRRGARRAGQAERAVVDLLPGAVGEGGLDLVVDVVAQRLVVLRQADAVLLGAERLADHLQLVRVLRRVALEDGVVGGDGVDLLVEQLRHALRVGLELDDVVRLGQTLVADLLDRGRAGGRADLLALERVLAGDRRLVLADQQVLAG